MTDVTWLTPDAAGGLDPVRCGTRTAARRAGRPAEPGRASLTHFDYFVLAMLSEAPGRTLRMTALAARTNATLARLSRVVSRLEAEGYVQRRPCPATGARRTPCSPTPAGTRWWRPRPATSATVRQFVVDALTAEDLAQLGVISGRLLARLDPDGRMFASGWWTCSGHDPLSL